MGHLRRRPRKLKDIVPRAHNRLTIACQRTDAVRNPDAQSKILSWQKRRKRRQPRPGKSKTKTLSFRDDSIEQLPSKAKDFPFDIGHPYAGSRNDEKSTAEASISGNVNGRQQQEHDEYSEQFGGGNNNTPSTSDELPETKRTTQREVSEDQSSNIAIKHELSLPEPSTTQLDEQPVETSPLAQLEDLLSSQESHWGEENADDASFGFKAGRRKITPESMEAAEAYAKFCDGFAKSDTTNERLFQLYRALPAPGVQWLANYMIRGLLQRLGTPMRKQVADLSRYLAVLDDMEVAGLPLNVAEWSTAIHLVGRCTSFVTNIHLSKAFTLWKKMESEAGLASTSVTFNIMFDIASKAGNWALAESFLEEMERRSLQMTRFGRVALMVHYGHKGDVAGIRRTYRAFLDVGEIVDTAVLNAVIFALLTAKETAAAEEIYDRMKTTHFEALKKGPLMSNYPATEYNYAKLRRANKNFARVLAVYPQMYKESRDEHREFQESIPLSPDIGTLYQLIRHHCTQSGDLDRVTELLDEMYNQFRFPLQGQVYIELFKGFAFWGGKVTSLWQREQLESTWQSYLQSALDPKLVYRARHEARRRQKTQKSTLSTPEQQSAQPLLEASAYHGTFVDYKVSLEDDEGTPNYDRTEIDGPVYLGTSVLLWVLRAYARCATPKRLEEIYLQIIAIWDRRAKTHPGEYRKLSDEMVLLMRATKRKDNWWQPLQHKRRA